MPYLTVPEAYTAPIQVYRYFCELASNKLDDEGVPEYFRVVDVVVLEPTKEAILQLLAAAEWLRDWGLVSYWTPEDEAPF